MIRYLFLFIILFSTPVLAVEALSGPTDFALGSLIASLVLVISCIFLVAFLVKKSNLIRVGGHKNNIKTIAIQRLTNKAQIQVVEINQQHYILGVTEQSINLIDKISAFDLAETNAEMKQKLTPAQKQNTFSTILSNIKKKNDE
jgi:flagellar protein FliO/FliZ